MFARWQFVGSNPEAGVSATSSRPAPQLRILLWASVFKLGYWAILLTGVCLWGHLYSPHVVYWPRPSPPVFVSHFTAYDGYNYLKLSKEGYKDGEPACVLYPLWPFLIGSISRLVGGTSPVVGLVLANGLSVAAWIALYRIVRQRWGPGIAKWTLIFLVAYPGSLFYQFIYSESLFLLLVVGLWWALEGSNTVFACLLAFLLPLTRPIGVFCILPIMWHVLSAWRSDPPTWMGMLTKASVSPERAAASGQRPVADSSEPGGDNPASSRSVCLMLALFCGWYCYLALMWFRTGDPFQGFEAQRFWGVHSVSNLWNPPKFFLEWLNANEWHELRGSLLDRCAFLLLICCLPTIWRLDKRLVVWTYVLGILPAMSGMFTSFTRFGSTTFPMFIALSVWLGDRSRWRLRYGLLVVFGVLHALVAWRYVTFRWAG